jgi:hypothetical protein
LLLLAVVTACRAAAPAEAVAPIQARVPSLAPLIELADPDVGALRRLFDDAKDRPRYIVALSPT